MDAAPHWKAEALMNRTTITIAAALAAITLTACSGVPAVSDDPIATAEQVRAFVATPYPVTVSCRCQLSMTTAHCSTHSTPSMARGASS